MEPRLVIAVLAWVPLLLGADWYQWRDASGTLQVTNQPARQLPPAAPPAGAPPAAAPAAAESADEGGAAAARRARERRLTDNQAHLELLRASGRDDAAALALENQLEDAIRADREALR